MTFTAVLKQVSCLYAHWCAVVWRELARAPFLFLMIINIAMLNSPSKRSENTEPHFVWFFLSKKRHTCLTMSLVWWKLVILLSEYIYNLRRMHKHTSSIVSTIITVAAKMCTYENTSSFALCKHFLVEKNPSARWCDTCAFSKFPAYVFIRKDRFLRTTYPSQYPLLMEQRYHLKCMNV